jgi:peptide/nickel transport system substrate-binding protein
MDEKGNPVPLLLASGEHDATAKLWTFRLRDGVVFHNGKPLTADDLMYTIRTWASPGSYYAPVMGTVIDYPAVRKVDRLTVQVPLKLAVADFPSLLVYLNGAIIPDGFTDFAHPVGTGPFKYQSFTPGSQSVFTKNRNYWMTGKPYLNELIVTSSFQADPPRVNALLAGSIDYLPQLAFNYARQYSSGGQFQVKAVQGPQASFFYMRTDTGPTKDVRVRQALRLLVNREQMVRDVYNGYGSVGNDLAGYTRQFFASDLQRSYDPEQAKSLLKAAGQENLHIQVRTGNVDAGFVPSTTLLKQQAALAGVTIEIDTLNPAVFWTAAGGYGTNQFSQDYWGQVPSLTAFYLQSFVTGAAYPDTHWGTPAHNKAVFDAVAAVDPAVAEQRWHAAQLQQFDQGGMILWGNLPFIDGLANNVHGIGPSQASFANDFNFRTAWMS